MKNLIRHRQSAQLNKFIFQNKAPQGPGTAEKKIKVPAANETKEVVDGLEQAKKDLDRAVKDIDSIGDGYTRFYLPDHDDVLTKQSIGIDDIFGAHRIVLDEDNKNESKDLGKEEWKNKKKELDINDSESFQYVELNTEEFSMKIFQDTEETNDDITYSDGSRESKFTNRIVASITTKDGKEKCYYVSISGSALEVILSFQPAAMAREVAKMSQEEVIKKFKESKSWTELPPSKVQHVYESAASKLTKFNSNRKTAEEKTRLDEIEAEADRSLDELLENDDRKAKELKNADKFLEGFEIEKK